MADAHSRSPQIVTTPQTPKLPKLAGNVQVSSYAVPRGSDLERQILYQMAEHHTTPAKELKRELSNPTLVELAGQFYLVLSLVHSYQAPKVGFYKL